MRTLHRSAHKTLKTHAGYQSRSYQEAGNLDAVYLRFIEARQKVLAAADPASTQAALCRLLPHPARCQPACLGSGSWVTSAGNGRPSPQTCR